MDKVLAGDRRAGWSARRSIRERHRRLLRQQWRALVGLATGMVAIIVLAALFTDGPQARGFVLGSGLTVTACALTALVVLSSGTAPLMMGELAEQWTAQELRPLTQHGWRLVNHFGLGAGDHDHVLVGPGGVILVETKWSAGSWAMTDRDHVFQAALGQTARNARQLAAWHDIARNERPTVEPVLVLWGQARSRLVDQPPVRHVSSGVVVMAGDQVKAWALRQGRGALTPDQVDTIWAGLAKHAGRRDELERRTRPMPGSLIELAVAGLGCLVSALVGFLAAGQVLGLLDDLLLWVLVGLVALAGLEWFRRRPHWPWQLRALQLGIASAYVLAAVAVANAYLTR